MEVEYYLIYDWEKDPFGTKKRFLGRLNALPKELSIRNKLGCPDITLNINDNTPLEISERYEEATIE